MERKDLINLYHQAMLGNETKSISILGFFFAYLGVIIKVMIDTNSIGLLIIIALLNFVISTAAIKIVSGYRAWKKHYLEKMQYLFDLEKISQMERATSFATDERYKRQITVQSIDDYSICVIRFLSAMLNTISFFILIFSLINEIRMGCFLGLRHTWSFLCNR